MKVRTEEVTDVDLEAAEEATLHARFQETRSKIALLSDSLSLLNHLRLDELAWVRYKNQVQQKQAREHVVAVTHNKAQNQIGKTTLGYSSAGFPMLPRIVENFMQKMCNVTLVPDMAALSNMDAWIRQAAAEVKAGRRLSAHSAAQVKSEELIVVVITDYSKLGVLQVTTLSKHAQLMAKLIDRNQRCHSHDLFWFSSIAR